VLYTLDGVLYTLDGVLYALDGVLYTLDGELCTLFQVGIGKTTEVAFFHKKSASLIVTDAVIFIPPEVRLPHTRWTATLSSKVNLPHIINFRALCRANLVTRPPKIQGGRNPCGPPSGTQWASKRISARMLVETFPQKVGVSHWRGCRLV